MRSVIKKCLTLSAIALIQFCYAAPTWAATETVEEFLRAFHHDPARMMQRLPSMVDENGTAHTRGFINENAPDWRMMVDAHDEMRTEIMGFDNPNPPANDEDTGQNSGPDRPDLLVEPGPMLRNLSQMQARGLTQVSAPEVPWPDSYWPIYKGNVANRYNDGGFPRARDWNVNFSYVQSHSAMGMIASGRIDALSPAEKYDYAVGDMSFGLTNYAWGMGRKYIQQWHMVPSWVGICHGWSGASSMSAAIPANPVTVHAPNGTPVTFYPQDIKALQSMLWAKGAPRARVAGSRCDVYHPNRNRNGRIIDAKCFDISPSTWHLAVVNQLGVHKRNFVMDQTYDYEVWNFPLVSFKYRYFNPQTWKETASVDAATISLNNFSVDKFKEFRSPDARYVVGIAMDVTYVVEIEPRRGTTNKIPMKTARYIYDLELDANKNIVGGEWYSNAHPDFIWTFNADAQASSPEDSALAGTSWNINEPVPAVWADSARRASSHGIPLSTFVLRIANPSGLPTRPQPIP